MKVIALDVMGVAGHSFHNFFMCNALAELGVDVIVITTKKQELDFSQAKFIAKNVLTPHYDKKSNFQKGTTYFISMIKFVYHVMREKPDIIHIHDFKIPLIEYYLIKLFHKRKIKVISSAHNILHLDKQAPTKHLTKLYNSLDRIIAHADENKQRLIQIFGVKPENIHVIPVGEYSYFTDQIVDKKIARESLGIIPDRKVLLFFGFIRKYKGLTILLEALATVRQSVPDVFLIIAGEAKEDYHPYDEQIQKLGLSDIILSRTDYIPIEDVPKYFSAADIAVLPYLYIYQSGILYLAFAHRRPVIATNVGGIPEVVEQGKSGYLIPPNNPSELANAIGQAFSDRSKLEEMGRYAYEMTKQKYSWQNIAKLTIEVYQQMISENDD